MKPGLLMLIPIIYSVTLNAQNNFEGKIIYKTETETGSAKNTFAEVFLKGNQMLLLGKDEDKNKPMHFLYDFNKGLSYNLGIDDSVAIVTKLTRSPFNEKRDDLMEVLNILNYRTTRTAYYTGSPMNTALKSIESWFSKELIFRIPDSVRSVQPPVIFFNDSSISLRVKINLHNMPEGDPLPGTITITASVITKEILSDSIFEIPKFRKIITLEDYLEDILKKFKATDAELLDKKTGIKLEVTGKPEMIEINKEPAPALPAPPKKKNKR